MAEENLSIGLALLAGFVSFISPCVLPLVPAYVGYMSGRATSQAADGQRNKFETFIHGVFFVLGFTIFFVGFGLLTAAASQQLKNFGIDIPTLLTRLGGVAVIFFGLYVMKALDPVFRQGLKLAEKMRADTPLALAFSTLMAIIFFTYFSWATESPIGGLILLLLILALFRNALNNAKNIGDFWYHAILGLQMALVMDTRKLEMGQSQTAGKSGISGYIGSVGIGIVFAAGRTPCIGPIYGSILALANDAAAEGDSLVKPAILLTAYSLGLGIPFLVTALALNQMTGLMRSLKRNMRKIEYASGILLLIIGVMILSGNLTKLSQQIGGSGSLADTSYRLEECSAAAAQGTIRLSTWSDCVKTGQKKLGDQLVFSIRMSSLEIGSSPRDFTTITDTGDTINLSDFRGKTVLLNFWTTGCESCRQEMSELQTLYEQDENTVILAVNFMENSEQVQRFRDELDVELTYPLLMDENAAINDRFKVRQYPTSYLIDPDGVIRAVHAGDLTGELLLDFLAEADNISEISELSEQNADNSDTTTTPTLNSQPIGLEIGNLAPDFTTITDTGDTINLSDFKGKTIILNFWATWCGPCRQEMPEFQILYEHNNDMIILAVNFEESSEQVQRFRDELDVKLTYPLLMDENKEINDLFNVRQYPTSYLIDPDGVIRAVYAGGLTGELLLDFLAEADDSSETDKLPEQNADNSDVTVTPTPDPQPVGLETPEFQTLYEHDYDSVILAVNFKESNKQVQSFRDKLDIELTSPLLMDENAGDLTGERLLNFLAKADDIREMDELPKQNADNSDATPTPDPQRIGLEIGNFAPDFTAVTDTGDTINLSDFKGKTIILNFWATWCGPCRQEMPEFQTLYKHDYDVVILAVNFMDSHEQVQRFRDDLEVELTYPLLMDENAEINDLFNVRQYPTSYLIDPDGVIRAIHAGSLTGELLLDFLAEADDSSEMSEPSDQNADNADATASPTLDPQRIGLEIGNFAPDFTTVTDTGDTINLSDFKGKTIILNFWATWCGPCRQEMPEFQTLYEHDDDVAILAVNFMDSHEQVQRFRDDLEVELTYPLLMDENAEINDLFNVRQYPTSYLIDPDGVIRAVYAGGLTGELLLDFLAEASDSN